MGHALDPTGVLYDTLTEASIDTEDTSQAGQTPAPVYMIFTYNLIFSSSKVHDRIISLYVYAYKILSWGFFGGFFYGIYHILMHKQVKIGIVD